MTAIEMAMFKSICGTFPSHFMKKAPGGPGASL
jgi:hypothetical protein